MTFALSRKIVTMVGLGKSWVEGSWRLVQRHFLCAYVYSVMEPTKLPAHTKKKIWDGILGYKFDKRLESFALCYSQSLLLADLKENHTILWFLKYIQENRQIGVYSWIAFFRTEKWGKILEFEKTRVYAQKPWQKVQFKNSISWKGGVQTVTQLPTCFDIFINIKMQWFFNCLLWVKIFCVYAPKAYFVSTQRKV